MPNDLKILTEFLADGKVDDYYSQILTASGGTEPYIWSIVDGSFGDGLELNSETGIISGIPIFYRTYTFTVRVTDSGEDLKFDED